MKNNLINRLEYWKRFPLDYILCKISIKKMNDIEKKQFKNNLEKYLKPEKGYFARYNYRFLKRILKEEFEKSEK